MTEIPDGLTLRTLPAAKYAVFTCTMKTLSATYPFVYQQWLPASAYELDMSASDFEYYLPNADSADSPVQIFIPIKQKEPVGS
jgi:predicted transcriptional regulator YdeE